MWSPPGWGSWSGGTASGHPSPCPVPAAEHLRAGLTTFAAGHDAGFSADRAGRFDASVAVPREPMKRSARRAADPPTEADLLSVAEPLRRFVEARAGGSGDAEDLVQEVLARLWEVRWRLERTALFGYGVVVARNLLVSERRGREVEYRNRPRLTPADRPADPVEAVLAADD